MKSRRSNPPTGRTILVVDDQTETLVSLRMVLEREGHRVLTAASAEEALAVHEQEPVQLMLVDYFMPVTTGEELIARVRERGDQLVQIVLQTGYAGEKPPRDMLRRLAIQGYHDKSDGPERLLLWVDVAFKAYDQLAAVHMAERLKTELLANVSHEFRTPLNIIVGYLDLLREGTFGDCATEAHGVFDKVRGNAGYLLELVEEFLDLSQLEAGALRLRKDQLEVPPLLRELGESFSLLVRTKPVEFVADVPETLPFIEADAAKLRVIVQNLLSNAAKFTSRGEIRLRATPTDDGGVAIAVSDTGPGIPAEQHEAVFEIFHQLQPHDGERKGVGLGLALARRFARMMRGDLTVASAVGEGTTFTVVLPGAGAGRGMVASHEAA
jgi:signal transduction histidine kinase